MSNHSIYEQEILTIERAEQILAETWDGDARLLQEYAELAENYKKLFRQFKKIVKLNDRQQRELLESKQTIELVNEDLKAVNATKDKFFSIISHDLKSPINSFLNVSTLLMDHIDRFNKAELREMAANVKKSGYNLLRLMENLLSWSRLQMDREAFDPGACTLNDLVEDVASALADGLAEKAIHLQRELPGRTQVYADANMIRFVLQNLLANAIKFTHRNGKVTLSAKPVGDMVHVSIGDNGIGISKKNPPGNIRAGFLVAN